MCVMPDHAAGDYARMHGVISATPLFIPAIHNCHVIQTHSASHTHALSMSATHSRYFAYMHSLLQPCRHTHSRSHTTHMDSLSQPRAGHHLSHTTQYPSHIHVHALWITATRTHHLIQTHPRSQRHALGTLALIKWSKT